MEGFNRGQSLKDEVPDGSLKQQEFIKVLLRT